VGPWASISADGITWETIRLATMGLPCGATSGPTYPDADLSAGASNGHLAILVGAEQMRDQVACANGLSGIRALVWVSSDGRTWQRSTEFTDLGRLNSRASQIWPTAAGWQALVDEPVAGLTSPWQSTDGLAWHETTLPDGQTWAQLNEEDGFLAFDDELRWRVVGYPEACDRGHVTPPTASAEPWILFRGDTTCASRDLIEWRTSNIGAPTGWNLYSLARTGYGTIVTGSDGVAWTRMPGDLGISRMADGPAGVIGLTGYTNETQTVWLLEP
jgi:hypothetical protein